MLSNRDLYVGCIVFFPVYANCAVTKDFESPSVAAKLSEWTLGGGNTTMSQHLCCSLSNTICVS